MSELNMKHFALQLVLGLAIMVFMIAVYRAGHPFAAFIGFIGLTVIYLPESYVPARKKVMAVVGTLVLMTIVRQIL